MSTQFKIHRFSKLVCLIFIFGTSLLGCQKLVTVPDPTTQLTSNTVYSNDAAAAAVLSGIYNLMSSNYGMMGGYTGIDALMGLSSDELIGYTTDITQSAFYTDQFEHGADFWTAPYQFIFAANSAIEGLNKSTAVSANEKKQLIAEAKFVRAYMHFTLVNLYGDVPLVLTTDYKVNQVVTRTPKDAVYAQIVQDLIDAQKDLSDDFRDQANNTTTERIRPNKGAATALLARTYLYLGKYADAEAQATLLINATGTYQLTADLNNTFLKNSTEAIWQLYPGNPSYNTADGSLFILTAAPDNYNNTVSMSTDLVNAFEPGDERLSKWVGSITVDGTTYYFPQKYKSYNYGDPISEYLMVFRLAEQYLIRAEARNAQGNTAGAIADLNIIRARARAVATVNVPNPLPALSPTLTKTQVSAAILHERRVELFTEQGHRWFDLKRFNLLDSLMSVVTPQKGGVWNSNHELLPIPLIELQRDLNLTQNPGYTGR